MFILITVCRGRFCLLSGVDQWDLIGGLVSLIQTVAACLVHEWRGGFGAHIARTSICHDC